MNTLFRHDTSPEPVECLGRIFETDEARRKYFLNLLREKLLDPAFRNTPGFPVGDDEDILRMSDPPYYTACPNPFLEEFVGLYRKPLNQKEIYQKEPLAVDSSEGKADPIYSAHAYHTKVPHKAIMRAILHYTSPGDLVLDGFCGSGMTGVAAQVCGKPDPEFKQAVEQDWQSLGFPRPVWGARRAILNDLGPAATFIAQGYNLPLNIEMFIESSEQFLFDLKEELGWMYETIHSDGKTKGQINFTVWSENFTCPECGQEIVFVEETLDLTTKQVRETFSCPKCKTDLTKDKLQRLMETQIDPATGSPWQHVKFTPVLINYSVGKSKYEKRPDSKDLDLLKQIARLPIPPSAPTTLFPIDEMYHGSRLAPKGFTRVHHLFQPRPLQSISYLWDKASSHPSLRAKLLFFIEQSIWTTSLLNRYQPGGFKQVNKYLPGVYYVSSQHCEPSSWYAIEARGGRLGKLFRLIGASQDAAIITTGDCAAIGIPDSCVDYIFTDPPFGGNIFYADLNFVVESWHRVRTSAAQEAIVDSHKNKGILDYQRLMQRCFEAYHRVLKPGHWMTVVFHNSKNSVWNAIQEAMLASGFVVADVRTLDKQLGSYRQVTSTAVKQDLVISAYRPTKELEERFQVLAGTDESAWEFVRSHLRQLPVIVVKNDNVEMVAERQNYLLYDRMVAFHVQRGYAVPLSLAEFHAGLCEKYPERDGMYFLPDQVSEYDRRRMDAKEIDQLELFVSDEKSAIHWVRRQLSEQPRKYQDLQPLYMKEAQRVWEKHEQPLELRTILDQNFVEDRDGTWRIADPKKEADLEQIRHRALMKEFQQYLDTKGKLKVVRTEALRAGFKECWQKQDYPTIVQMAKRVPDAVIQEDPALLMYFDNALMRTGE